MNAEKRLSREESRDLPCIWMLAGVLNYKVCHREYDCEDCEVHMALQGRLPAPGAGEFKPARENARWKERENSALEEQISTSFSRIMKGSKLYLDRCYSPTNFWLRPGSDDTVIGGMDENILRILHPVTEIVPPEPGKQLRRNQFCGILVRNEMTIPLHSPISGEVVAVNEHYLDEVYDPDGEPYQEPSWLFRLTPRENVHSVDDLCRGEEMLRWYLGRIRLLKHYLRDAISRAGVESVGMTMADGGEAETNLEMIMGEEQYREFVEELFRRL